MVVTQRLRVSANQTIESALRQVSLFADLSEECLQILARSAMRTRFAAGQLIFRQGDPANRFFVVTDGKVGLIGEEAGEPYRFSIINRNEVLGWSWLFPPYTWHFSARAIVPTEAIFFAGLNCWKRAKIIRIWDTN